MKRPSTSARRYAEAAFEIAREDNDVAGWLADLRATADGLSSPAVSGYFRDPNASTEEKVGAVRRLAGDVRPHVLNLLLTLTTRQRMNLLPGIVQEFETLDRDARGISDASVTVARQMSAAEVRELEQRLRRVTGGNQVNVSVQVDPSILGGIVVRIGDQLFDSSVRGRLERLRQELAV